MLFEIISFVLMAAILATSLYVSYVLFNKNKQLTTLSMALYQDIFELQKHVKEQQELSQITPIDQTDGFVRFLEDSRNSAFEFIDTMQNAIKSFDSKTKDIFAKTSKSPDLKQIKEAYQELKANTLPKDMPNN